MTNIFTAETIEKEEQLLKAFQATWIQHHHRKPILMNAALFLGCLQLAVNPPESLKNAFVEKLLEQSKKEQIPALHYNPDSHGFSYEKKPKISIKRKLDSRLKIVSFQNKDYLFSVVYNTDHSFSLRIIDQATNKMVKEFIPCTVAQYGKLKRIYSEDRFNLTKYVRNNYVNQRQEA